METWKDIKDFEGLYQVSNYGRVKSIGKYVNCKHGLKQFKRERILKTATKRYKKVGLYKNTVKIYYNIHRLVALAFIPNPENKSEINHKNGIKTDNRIENLEWCTHKENIQHAVKNRLRSPIKGENHYKTKLKDAQVIEIFNSNQSNMEIVKKYNASYRVVYEIRIGKNWKHLTANL